MTEETIADSAVMRSRIPRRDHMFRYLAFASTYAVERGVILAALFIPLIAGASPAVVGTIEILLTAGSLGIALGPLGTQAAVMHDRFVDRRANFWSAIVVAAIGGMAMGALVGVFAGATPWLAGLIGASLSVTTVIQFRIRVSDGVTPVLVAGGLMAGVFVVGMTVVWLSGVSWVVGVPIVIALTAVSLFLPVTRIVTVDAGPGPAQLAAMMRFGVPLTIGAFAGWLVDAADRFFITELLGLEAVGGYGTIYRMVGLIGGILTTLVLWWRVEAFRHGESWAGRRMDRVAAGATALAVVVGLLGWWPVALVTARLTGLDIATTGGVAAWVMAGVVLFTVFNLYVAFLTVQTRVGAVAMAWILAALANLGLNWLLVPRVGMVGAAQATAVAYGVGLIVAFVLTRRTLRSGRL